MRKWLLRAVYAALVLTPVAATADYLATAGGATTVFAFVCSATKVCPAMVLIDSTNVEKATAGNPLRVDPTGTTTQPVSQPTAANLNATVVQATAANLNATVTGTVTANAGTNLNTSALATSALQGTNTATTAHTCSVAGYSILGCLGQVDDDLKAPIPAGTAHIGTVGTAPYPDTAVPYTATATGTTAATTATLAGAVSVTTYICGFSIRANATAAATGNATVTGVITATLNFTQWTAPNASGLGVTEMVFTPCIPASAANTSIAVVSAAPGTGGVVSVTAWGYKL
jgi:hypothetical protein